METAQKADLIKQLTAFLDVDKITAEYLQTVSIVVPPHGKGLGVDTTVMYKLLPPEAQYGHNIVNPHPAAQASRRGYYVDANRSHRQTDVVMQTVSKLTEQRWRTDMDKDNCIVFTIALKPLGYIKKNIPKYVTLCTLIVFLTKNRYIDDAKTILKFVTAADTKLVITITETKVNNAQ